ncbi:MAG: GtrA family protein [Bifidobacteriaceae bacterium]|jgi:putative flippase GtrA|nr:GtrA family protein [Bifidobacteriaceae bacterium]
MSSNDNLNSNQSIDDETLTNRSKPVPNNFRYHMAQFIKFGIVGAICYIVDVSIYNLLVLIPGINILSNNPVTAKFISSTLSTLLSWVLNRNWAFREHKTSSKRKELTGYIIINIIGMAIAAGCLGFSRYILNLSGYVADNLSGNIIGSGLATIWRYLAYKFILYKKR